MKTKNLKKKLFKINWINIYVIFVVLVLCFIGCLMVFSASYYSAELNYGTKFYFFNKQIIGVLIGLLGMVIMSFIDYHLLVKLKWWMVGGTFLLLALVLIPGIGVENYGARRWINLGFFTFQPSEIAKFVLVFFCSIHLSQNYQKISSLKTFIPPLLVGLVFCALVIFEPNMSITMCLALILVAMLFLGGVGLKYFFAFGSIGVAGIPIMILAEPYRVKRLMAFLDPWSSPKDEGFQLIQSLYALGSGGLFGVGLFNSRQKYLFLPFAESDFIFSIIGEEIGFAGCVLLLLIFFLLIFLLFEIGKKACDRLGTLIACGVGVVIAVQTLLNVAVVTGSIPPTGLPLPFISAGSTGLVVFMSAIGVVLNISKQSNKTVYDSKISDLD